MRDIPLKGGHYTSDPRLDRIPEFDPRNLNFLSRRSMMTEVPREKEWFISKHLDQGQEGACVGFGFAHEAISTPFPVRWVTEDDARKIYNKARKLDQWPGEDYEGTSTLAGAKAMQEMGLISQYRWTYSYQVLALAVSYDGPALIGVNWYSGMINPNSDGFLRPTGNIVGGHLTTVYSVNPREEFFGIWNSWGKSWGQNGTAKISFEDMAYLLDTNGEACIPVARKYVIDPHER